MASRKHFISSSSPRCLSPQRSPGISQLGCLEKVTKARETATTQSTEFDIPFDRQQFADYLNVERTALSKELGKMQNDGLIKVKKNHFVIC